MLVEDEGCEADVDDKRVMGGADGEYRPVCGAKSSPES